MTDPLSVETDLDIRVTARDGLAHRRPIQQAATLRWCAGDPWAVHLTVEGLRRPWVFGWELLTAATGPAGRAGEGDVRIRRATTRDFEILLASPNGSATVRVDAIDLSAFVAVVQPRQSSAVWRASAAFAAGLRVLLDGNRP